MSRDILKEVVFVSHSLLMGIIIAFVYDGFLILRKLIKHNIFWISLEDLIFWIFCAISVFGMLYRENNGTLRWFAVAGAFLGMVVYKKTISIWIVKAVSGVLLKLSHVICRFLTFICKPFILLGKKGKSGCGRLKQRGNKFGKYAKNRLTAYVKALKIILCKR